MERIKSIGELDLKENIDDRLVEWEVVDSAGFSIRPPSGTITNDQPYKSFRGPLVPFAYVNDNATRIQRMTGYLQWSLGGLAKHTLLAYSRTSWAALAVE